MFQSVLVANRGEIAVRIMRTLRRLGIRSIAVFSDADARALHTQVADVAVHLGPTPASQSYLSVERVLDAARRSGADAIHPGYGFLSENATFAHACAEAGLVFIGPPPQAIEIMGDKLRAKALMQEAGVPVLPSGAPGDAQRIGYPLLVKAAAGGGGKGMRVVRSADALPAAVASAGREAAAAFGDGTVFLERYLERPRHIEIQVLADAHGGVLHIGERECSLQRRHQKIIEECPSPLLDNELRLDMGDAAVVAAASCGYVGAGTVEFIVPNDDPRAFAFLEMNTRLQVEHPVTEEVYGIDLVAAQLRIAAGEQLWFDQADVTPRGHAIEGRVYAEDPARGFLPTGGRVLLLAEPPLPAPGARIDSGIAQGMVVGSAYDPMLAKVIAHGEDRASALRLLDELLAEYAALGVTTNVGFLRALLADPDVRAGRLDTGMVERRLDDLVAEPVPDDVYAAAALAHLLARQPVGPVVDPFDIPGGWRLGARAPTTLRLRAGGADPIDVRVYGTAATATVAVGGAAPLPASADWDAARLRVTFAGVRRTYHAVEDGATVWIARDGYAWALREEEQLEAARHGGAGTAGGTLIAPMPGTVTVVHVAEGDVVDAGQALLVVEAMKMEHPITAPFYGVVTQLDAKAGQPVGMGQLLAVVEPRDG